MGGWEGVWRCDDLEEEEEMQFLCTATGVLCFVFGKGGEICTGTEREREGEGEGEKGVSRNDGGKYEQEKQQRSGVLLSILFFFLLLSSSSRLCQ